MDKQEQKAPKFYCYYFCYYFFRAEATPFSIETIAFTTTLDEFEAFSMETRASCGETMGRERESQRWKESMVRCVSWGGRVNRESTERWDAWVWWRFGECCVSWACCVSSVRVMWHACHWSQFYRETLFFILKEKSVGKSTYFRGFVGCIELTTNVFTTDPDRKNPSVISITKGFIQIPRDNFPCNNRFSCTVCMRVSLSLLCVLWARLKGCGAARS